MKKSIKNRTSKPEPSSIKPEAPFDSFDMVNAFGTYNVQPTADTDNEYPKIAGGLGKDGGQK